ncbi:MAG TPA: type II toxin-antitoxin system HicB family antitoxin [candidate division WOR-3 bacterium]|uniref:Type II toxin-antitoxin system HicB family antitoxin n=1 Tax=candidate division WOR-3 bacterium TaxID=2052148 RepID=A0A9C9EL08_UNCW3|nr:type II toxin-antitoxin system HicB family antitoxin [candidate division WOR-3 bacterium]
MLIEYIEAALKKAHYEIINDRERYYGEIPGFKGLWATGKTLEQCRKNLREVLEGWILLSIQKRLPLPKLGKLVVKPLECVKTR